MAHGDRTSRKSLGEDEKRARRKIRNRVLVISFFAFIAFVVLLESPFTRIRAISVQGNRSIPAQEIVAYSGLKRGMSLWQVNGGYVQTRIMQGEPLVQSVHVHMDLLKGQVNLKLQERGFVAILQTPAGFYRLLDDGVAYDKVPTSSGLSWPIISGTKVPPVLLGKPVNSLVTSVCKQLSSLSAKEVSSVSEIYLPGYQIATVDLANGFAGQVPVAKVASLLSTLNSVVGYFSSHGYSPGMVDLTGSPPYRYTPFKTKG